MTPLLSRKEKEEFEDSPLSVRRALLDKIPPPPPPPLKDNNCSEGPGLCAHMITATSIVLILVSLPLSLLFVVKVVQEYERAVIFRLGRLLSGGARGPGVFFIIPCVDVYEKIDMRSQTFEIPPQEVKRLLKPNQLAVVI